MKIKIIFSGRILDSLYNIKSSFKPEVKTGSIEGSEIKFLLVLSWNKQFLILCKIF